MRKKEPVLTLNTRLPASLMTKLRKEADERGITVTAMVRILLHNALFPEKAFKV